MTNISMETSALDIVSILHMEIVQGLDIYIVKTVSGLVVWNADLLINHFYCEHLSSTVCIYTYHMKDA